MAKVTLKAGTTSYIAQVFIQDSSSTTGSGLTGLAWNTGSLTAYFHRDTDTTATAISLITMTVGTFTSSGFKEIDPTNMPGWYQLCPPNTALATGAKSCAIHLKGATNMAPLPLEIELTGFDNQSTTDGNLSKLTSLTFTGANKVDASVRDFGGTTVTARDIGLNVLLSSGTGTGQLDFTSGVVKGDVRQWVGGTVPAPNVTGVPKSDVVDWLGAAPNALAQGKVDSAFVIRSNTATAGGSATITLDAGASAVDNTYQGLKLSIVSGTGAGQARAIAGYVGSTQVATVTPTWITNPDATSVFIIEPHGAVNVQRWNNGSIAIPAVAGVPKVDVVDWLGSAPNVLISGRVDANAGVVGDKTGYAIGTGGITASSFAASAIDSSALATSGENAIADALLDRANAVETGYTPRQSFRLMLSALAAKLSGAATTTVTIRNVTDAKDRITATVDANGNRTAVTLDGT